MLGRELQGGTANLHALKSYLKHDNGAGVEFLPYAEKLILTKKTSTSIRYDWEIKALREYAGNSLRFSDITHVWMNAYQAYLLKDKQWNTMLNAFKFIRSVCNAAIRDGLTTYYPFKDWKYPTYQKPEKQALEQNDIDKLYEFMDKSGPEVKTITAFFLLETASGLRHSDWRNFSIVKNVSVAGEGGKVDLYLRTTKTGTPVRLPVDLMPSLKKILDYITANDLNYRYSLEHTNRMLKVIGPAAGVTKRLTTHVARHTFASMMLNAGYSERFIAEAMGITVKQVSTYAHLSSEKFRREVERLGGL